MTQHQAAVIERKRSHWRKCSLAEGSNYRDRKQEIILTQQQKAESMLAEKQAIFNNDEEHKVHGICILQTSFSVDNYMFKLTKVVIKSQILQHCLQKQGTLSSQSTRCVTEQRLLDSSENSCCQREFHNEVTCWVFRLCKGTDRQK